MTSEEDDRSSVASPESVYQQTSDSKALRGIVVAYLVVKAIVDETAAVLILTTQDGGEILGRSLSGSTAMAIGDILFGIFYLAFACAVILRWPSFALLAIPILVVDLFVSTNWGAPLVLLVLLIVPSIRRRLWG